VEGRGRAVAPCCCPLLFALTPPPLLPASPLPRARETIEQSVRVGCWPESGPECRACAKNTRAASSAHVRQAEKGPVRRRRRMADRASRTHVCTHARADERERTHHTHIHTHTHTHARTHARAHAARGHTLLCKGVALMGTARVRLALAHALRWAAARPCAAGVPAIRSGGWPGLHRCSNIYIRPPAPVIRSLFISPPTTWQPPFMARIVISAAADICGLGLLS
jgi:hypothetical protein